MEPLLTETWQWAVLGAFLGFWMNTLTMCLKSIEVKLDEAE